VVPLKITGAIKNHAKYGNAPALIAGKVIQHRLSRRECRAGKGEKTSCSKKICRQRRDWTRDGSKRYVTAHGELFLWAGIFGASREAGVGPNTPFLLSTAAVAPWDFSKRMPLDSGTVGIVIAFG
jgi:hypothetical protein